jgi:ribonucleoside-triphosphate reductase
MITKVIKRDGRSVDYNGEKIAQAILKAMGASKFGTIEDARRIEKAVYDDLKMATRKDAPKIEEIQDNVERQLMLFGFNDVAKQYILYRANRSRIREANTKLMKTIDEITTVDARVSDMKRDNANIDGNTPMGSMLQIGTAGAKAYNESYLLTKKEATAFRNGDIHIHDFDFYSLTSTCCQIDIIKLFKDGFSTGHGFLREPNSIQSYAALAAIAIQSNQNDQHGGQSIPNFDYGMAEGIKITFNKMYVTCLAECLEDILDTESEVDFVKVMLKNANEKVLGPTLGTLTKEFDNLMVEQLVANKCMDESRATKLIAKVRMRATNKTDRATYQAMEGFVHNLNTMHSRAGAQTPFSSINYGTDTTPEGRMAIKNILLATDAGLGHGETCIFPIHIFKVKEGVNYNEKDPNYDLFRLSCKVSAKRLFPNYVFLDSPFNLQYYKEGKPETEVATMGCRTRVMGNVFDPENEISYSRGNLSFTSINLPRIAIESNGDEKLFYKKLDEKLDLVKNQLLDRFEIQAKKHVYNYPFLMGQGVWLGSDKLKPDDEVREVIKHGSLSIGFIGLAETLFALYGAHHGMSDAMEAKGLEIIGYMRDYCDRQAEKYQLNFGLLGTPAEGLSGRFVKMDRQKFGSIPGVTDKEYYTNSFHIPVGFNITAFDKIKKEAPFHNLTNAGHISYVELDGDTSSNVYAFEAVVRCMHDAGIGYGSINHPVDRDPICGYVGVIGDVCPRCGRSEGEHVPEARISELRRKFPTNINFKGIE